MGGDYIDRAVISEYGLILVRLPSVSGPRVLGRRLLLLRSSLRRLG